jgi:hypothetical protein
MHNDVFVFIEYMPGDDDSSLINKERGDDEGRDQQQHREENE